MTTQHTFCYHNVKQYGYITGYLSTKWSSANLSTPVEVKVTKRLKSEDILDENIPKAEKIRTHYISS